MKHFIWIIMIWLSACSNNMELSSENEPAQEPYYQEPYRPQFHFTPETKWMNDPNGMVYFDGEYHLFYQYYPDSTVWGPMHWGHAISTDLITWEHLPIALYPDELGLIFSGSAVVDWNNTSGLGQGDQPPLVAIFTYHDLEKEQAGIEEDFQYQGIAYSNDKGRTWIKYEDNPVLPNQGIRDFRDPKVMWHEPTESWIMTLAVKDHVEFYRSDDLIDWFKLSDFGIKDGAHGGVWECPDLFELETDYGQSRWVLIVSINPGGSNGGSATQYFIGDFDGQDFINENPSNEILWLDYGTDNYAGVTWSNIPEEDGRRLFMGWMSNWDYARLTPTDKWRSAMTVTRELELVENQDGELRVTSWPIMEYKQLVTSSQKIEDNAQHRGYSIPIGHDLLDIQLDVDLKESTDFKVSFFNDQGDSVHLAYNLPESTFSLDRRNSGIVDFEEGFARLHQAPYEAIENEMQLRIMLDWSSIETFVDGGLLTMTQQIFPGRPLDQMHISSSGDIGITSEVKRLKSIWTK